MAMWVVQITSLSQSIVKALKRTRRRVQCALQPDMASEGKNKALQMICCDEIDVICRLLPCSPFLDTVQDSVREGQLCTWVQERRYVSRNARQLRAESNGRVLSAFLELYFAKYVDFNFTANMENKLDEISGS